MGMGYTIPEGMSAADFKAEYAKWEQKLQNSGFKDIEYRSPSHTGHFTPFFKENGSTATFQLIYDPFREEYYSLARSFNAHMSEYPYPNSRCNRWSVVFRGNVYVYRKLWELHCEGVPYRAVAKYFSGESSKWTKSFKPLKADRVKSRSVFWAHDHTHKVLNEFWKWAAKQGYNDPRLKTAAPTGVLDNNSSDDERI